MTLTKTFLIRIRLSAPHFCCTQFMSHLKIYGPRKNHYYLLSFQLFVLPPALLLSPLMSMQNGSCRIGMMNLATQHLSKGGTAHVNHRNSAIVAPKLGPKLDCSRHLGNLKRVCAWTEHFLGFVNDSTLLHQPFLRKQKHSKYKARSIWINNSNIEIFVVLKLAIYTTTSLCY